MPLEEELIFDFSALRSNRLYATKGLYQDVNSILDKELIKKLKKLKVFLIGCGALLGCEISKDLAIRCGVGTSNSGKINVTDMDTIELSNLSRQFLYRASDINKSKSDTLVNKITSYKDNYKNTFNAFNYEVGKNSEDIFCKKWWKSHDSYKRFR